MSEKMAGLEHIAHGSQMDDVVPEVSAWLSERRQRRIEKRRDILVLALTLGLEKPDQDRKMFLMQTWILNGDLLEDEWTEVRRIGRIPS